MKNFVKPGNTVGMVAPRALKSGDGVKVGAAFGVAATDVPAGAVVQLTVEGVFDFSTAGAAVADGTPVYFDEGTQQASTSGTLLVGYACDAWQTPAGCLRTKLTPSAASA